MRIMRSIHILTSRRQTGQDFTVSGSQAANMKTPDNESQKAMERICLKRKAAGKATRQWRDHILERDKRERAFHLPTPNSKLKRRQRSDTPSGFLLFPLISFLFFSFLVGCHCCILSLLCSGTRSPIGDRMKRHRRLGPGLNINDYRHKLGTAITEFRVSLPED